MSRPARTSLTTAAALAVALLGLPAAAHAADRNHDRLPDRWEKAHHLSLKVDQRLKDQDHDGLVNLAEYQDHTNPRRADSDRDGTPDGAEDHDGDGQTNLAEQPAQEASGGDATPPASGDHHEGETARYATVASYAQGAGFGGPLTLTRADGTTVTAFFGERTLLLCGSVPQGPFSPCDKSRLVAGAPVAGAEHGTNDGGADVWRMVRLLVPAGSTPPPAPTPTPPAPTPPPTQPAAPAPGGTIASFTGGVLTIDRPSGTEHPAGTLADGAVITCVHVHDGQVTSSAPCGADALLAGRQVGITQRTLVDGVPRWTRVDVLVAE